MVSEHDGDDEDDDDTFAVRMKVHVSGSLQKGPCVGRQIVLPF